MKPFVRLAVIAMPGQSLNRVGGGEGFAIRTNGNDVVLDNRGDLRAQAG